MTLRKEFAILRHIIAESNSFLVIAHTRPDPDTIGATLALVSYLSDQGKSVVLACADTFPDTFTACVPPYKVHPLSEIDTTRFAVIIGCDNIDRGFANIIPHTVDTQITIGIDHHPQTSVPADMLITDHTASSTCQILCDFFADTHHTLSPYQANALAIGILGDTRLFYNPNTSEHTLDAIAHCVASGADLPQLMHTHFLEKSPETLHLWGKALSHTRRISPYNALVTALTSDDLSQCALSHANLKEELKEIASLLSAVPETTFSLILLQIAPNVIKGSIRAERDRHIDTTAIAGLFGGGGHHLASGFEMHGKIVAEEDSWTIL